MNFDVEAIFRGAGEFVVKLDQHPVGALVFVMLAALAVVAIVITVRAGNQKTRDAIGRTAARRGR